MKEIKKRADKKGLSPVIATVLLISLALILALIVFLWARSFVKEKAQKFGEPIENACGDISFDAEVVASDGKVYVNNVGNVPLYGVEVRKKESGASENLGIGNFGNGLPVGGSKSADVEGAINPGEEVIVVPIILGETENYKKPYTCDEGFAKPVQVV